jgi:hypothetical protein
MIGHVHAAGKLRRKADELLDGAAKVTDVKVSGYVYTPRQPTRKRQHAAIIPA